MADHIIIGDKRPWLQVEQTVAGNKDFEFDFPIFQDEDLEVYVDADLQTLITHYAVTGAGEDEGGQVTFVTAPDVGAIITMRRRLVIQRTSDFQESGEFRAKVLNDELDYQTAGLQQVTDDAERSVRLAPTAPVIDLEFTPEASKVLAVNDTGDGMTMGPTVGQIASAGTSATTASAAAAAASSSATSAAASAADAHATARPYDISLIAGFGKEMELIDLVAGRFGKIKMVRPGSLLDFEWDLEGAPTGGDVEVDIRKNGTSVFSALPSFADGTTTLTPGVLKTDGTADYVRGDVVTFHITEVGATVAGSGLSVTVLGVST